MKILHIYELGPLNQENTFGGIEVAILELCRHLAQRGHDVTILTGVGKGKERGKYLIGDVKIIAADFAGLMRATWSPTNLKLVRQLAFPFALKDDTKYEVYHGHLYISGLIANCLARKHKAIAINTLHGSYYPIWNLIENPFKAAFFKAGERLLAPLLAKISHLQIHTGSYFAEQVLEWGAPEDKVKVIYNGVNLNQFRPRAEVENSVPIIFTARRLVKKNGLEYLIKAMPIILKNRECHLYIAGNGPERPKLETLTRVLGMQDHITFLGLVRHAAIPNYLACADLAVVPSLIEATSLFMLEAMAMCKPVIATRSGAIEEIINSDNGVLVEPMDVERLAEKVLELLVDAKRRQKIGKNAYKTARGLSWERIARETEEEYYRAAS